MIRDFYEMCADILHYTPEEIRYQEAEWERAAAVTIPAVYEGLPEILHTYVENGGKICVSSHSMRKTILRDYEAAGLPTPELIFDWACPEGKRKPHPYALQETMRILNLKPEELLMVDENSKYKGKLLSEIPKKENTLVIMIQRGEQVIIPHGNIRLESGDMLVVSKTEI